MGKLLSQWQKKRNSVRKKPIDLLEIGTGKHGGMARKMAEQLARKGGEEFRIVASDKKAITTTQLNGFEKIEKKDVNRVLRKLVKNKETVKSFRCDYLISNTSFYKADSFLKKLGKVLEPNAPLCITEHNKKGHIIEELLKRNGFKIIKKQVLDGLKIEPKLAHLLGIDPIPHCKDRKKEKQLTLKWANKHKIFQNQSEHAKFFLIRNAELRLVQKGVQRLAKLTGTKIEPLEDISHLDSIRILAVKK